MDERLPVLVNTAERRSYLGFLVSHGCRSDLDLANDAIGLNDILDSDDQPNVLEAH